MGRKFLPAFSVIALLAATSTIGLVSGENRHSPTLEIFDCGEMQFDDIGFFADTGEFDGREWTVVVPCYLIRHPKGLLLWDAGVSAAMVSSPENGANGILTTIDKPLVDSLAESGVAVSDIDLIALSHMHPDHAGSANTFAGTATWLTSAAQFDHAFRSESLAMGFDPSTYSRLQTGPVTHIEDVHDVFGDGTVVIHATPGHTPGHQVLFVDLKNYGPVVLSGDLHIVREGREKRLVASFNFDRDMTLASIDYVEALLAERNAQLVIQHSAADYDALPHAPDVMN